MRDVWWKCRAFIRARLQLKQPVLDLLLPNLPGLFFSPLSPFLVSASGGEGTQVVGCDVSDDVWESVVCGDRSMALMVEPHSREPTGGNLLLGKLSLFPLDLISPRYMVVVLVLCHCLK